MNGGSWTRTQGSSSVFHRRLQAQPLLFSPPPQTLHLVARVRNGSTWGIRGMSTVAPESNQRKGGKLLQFLADRFYDVEALRDYLFRKQVSKVHQKNR